MNNQQLQLVTFEQAKRLKEAGFDCPTYLGYGDGKFNLEMGELYGDTSVTILAPTVALALKWFRDVKNIFGIVNQYQHTKKWYHTFNFSKDFKSYELAESALLDELLTLIEK